MMKKALWVLLMSVTLWITVPAQPARAGEDARVDRLLELLVQKGVITGDEAVELKAAVDEPEPAAAASRPAKPPVNIKGHLKMQGQWTENDATTNNDTFRIRQARVEFYGDPAPQYSYKFSFAAERTDPTLLDAAITYRMSPRWQATFGQFKLPFSRESLQSGSALDLLERSWFLDRFRPANARDVGIKLTYAPHDRFRLETGAFHGNGKNATDSNDQKLWIARASGALKLGSVRLEPEAAYIYAPSEDDGAGPLEQSLLNTAGFGPYDKLQKQWGVAAFTGMYSIKYEYMQGRFSPQSPTVLPVLADGYHVQLGAQISPRLDSFLRFERFDENRLTTTAGDTEWVTLGLGWQAEKNLRYKLNYTWKKEAAASTDNNRLGLEILTKF